MKISNYIYAGAVNSYSKNNAGRKYGAVSEFSQVLDTVEISSDGKSRLAENGEVRMDKVNSIKEKINSGAYKLDAAAVARNMLSGSYLY